MGEGGLQGRLYIRSPAKLHNHHYCAFCQHQVMSYQKQLVPKLKAFLKARPYWDENLCEFCFFSFYMQLLTVGAKREQLFDPEFYEKTFRVYIWLFLMHCHPTLKLKFFPFCDKLFDIIKPEYSHNLPPFAELTLFENVVQNWQICKQLKTHPANFFTDQTPQEIEDLSEGIARL